MATLSLNALLLKDKKNSSKISFLFYIKTIQKTFQPGDYQFNWSQMCILWLVQIGLKKTWKINFYSLQPVTSSIKLVIIFVIYLYQNCFVSFHLHVTIIYFWML